SAQTGVADKLMGRRAAHDPTAWFAPRTTLGLGSYCLTTCTYSDDSEFVPGKTGDYPNASRIASLSSLILALSDGTLRGPCYSSLILTLPVGPFCGTSPNARSAQTGVADKLRGRGTSHDPTAWFAERPMLLFSHSHSAWYSVLRNITKRAKRTNRRSRQTQGTRSGPRSNSMVRGTNERRSVAQGHGVARGAR